MIEVKKVEPKVQNGKKVIAIKNAFINENGIICDESGAVGIQLQPELPYSDVTFDFKITFVIDDDMDIDAPDEGEFDNTETPDGYEGLAF